MKSLLLLIVLTYSGCVIRDKNDIYNYVSIGSPLTREILMNTDQIIKNDSDLILIYDISSRFARFDPHLLFYDKDLKLYAACYFPSDKVESLNDNVITGYLFEDRNKRKNNFRNDLPVKYKIDFRSRESFTASFRESNKVIDKIILDSAYVKLIVRKSESNTGLDWHPSLQNDSIFDSYFIQDTLVYPVSHLHFDYKLRTISVRTAVEFTRFNTDYMIVPEKTALDSFYTQFINQLTYQNKPKISW
jgi:hypothetical protein